MSAIPRTHNYICYLVSPPISNRWWLGNFRLAWLLGRRRTNDRNTLNILYYTSHPVRMIEHPRRSRPAVVFAYVRCKLSFLQTALRSGGPCLSSHESNRSHNKAFFIKATSVLVAYCVR